MNQEKLLTKNDVARRWNCSNRTVDRLRLHGRLPWLDLTGGRGGKPLVRFREVDVLAYETSTRMAPLEEEVGQNGAG